MSYNTLPLQPHDNNWIGGDTSAWQPSSSQMVRWWSAIPFHPLRDLKTNFRHFLLPILNANIWTTSSVLLKKELQKQSGTMVRMAQGVFESPVPWAELCEPCWQLSEHWDKGFPLHWGSAQDTCWHVQLWGNARVAGLFKMLQLKCWQEPQPSLPMLSLASFCSHLVWADSISLRQRRALGVPVHSPGCCSLTSGVG